MKTSQRKVQPNSPDYALAERVFAFLSASKRLRSGSAMYHMHWLAMRLQKLGVDAIVEVDNGSLRIEYCRLFADDKDRVAALDLIQPLYIFCFREPFPRSTNPATVASRRALMAHNLSAFYQRLRYKKPLKERDVNRYVLDEAPGY